MTLVDTNILLDLVTADPVWADWSIAQLEAASLVGPLLINDVIVALPVNERLLIPSFACKAFSNLIRCFWFPDNW